MTRSTDGSILCDVGISYPLAAEIGRQMTAGVGNANLLCLLGLNAGPAIELARQITAGTFSDDLLARAMWNPITATAIALLGGVVPLWTPLATLENGATLAAWWNPRDTSKITFNGSQVASFTDSKSGIVLSQSTSANQPVWSATARNGTPGLIFNGTTQFLQSAASPGLPATATAFAAMVQAFSNASFFQVALSWDGSEGEQAALREIGTDPPYFFNSNTALQATATWNGVDTFVFGAADGISTLQLMQNGAAAGFISSYTPSVGNGADPILMGARNPAHAFWSGVIQDCFIINGVLSGADYQRFTGYVSWNTGLNGSNLPTGHPYKNAPPRVAAAIAPPAGLPVDVLASGIVTHQTFRDDFTSLSTIDTTDSRAAGFNWYVHRQWPQAQNPFGNWAGITSQGATPAGDISVGSSLLTLSDYPGGTTGLVIQSAAATGTGTTFVGTTFSGGGYFEVSMAVPNPGGAINTMPSWPAAWFMDVRWFIGQVLRGAEPDIIEALPSNGSVALLMAAHDWDFVNNINYNTGLTPSGPADVTQQNRYGFWWVPASKNNGIGVLRRYVNGVYQGQVLYSATGGATPAFAPSNPNGVMSVIDSGQLVMNLSCGPSPLSAVFDYVSVCQ